MRPYTLYWTNFRRYEECPQKFLWYCGRPGFDEGGGDGRPKPKPEKKSEHHAVMGIVIGNVLERFYNDELWKNQIELKHRLLPDDDALETLLEGVLGVELDIGC